MQTLGYAVPTFARVLSADFGVPAARLVRRSSRGSLVINFGPDVTERWLGLGERHRFEWEKDGKNLLVPGNHCTSYNITGTIQYSVWWLTRFVDGRHW